MLKKLKPYKYIVMVSIEKNKMKLNDNKMKLNDNKMKLNDNLIRDLKLLNPTTRIAGLSILKISNEIDKCYKNSTCLERNMQKGGETTGDITSMISLGGEFIRNSEIIARTIIKAVIKITDTLVPVAQEAIFGDLADKPWDEVAPELTSALQKDALLVKNMIKDPRVQEAIKEVAEAYAMVAIQMIDAVKPSISMMTDEVWESISEVAIKSAVGSINTVFNLTEAAVGEIPIFGGAIDIIISIIRGVNKAMLAASPAIEFGASSVGTGYYTGKKLFNTARKGFETVNKASSVLSSAVNNIQKQAFDTGVAIGNKAKEQIRERTEATRANLAEKMTAPIRAASDVASQRASDAIRKITPQPETKTIQGSSSSSNNIQQGGRKLKRKKINTTKKRIVKSLKRFTLHKHK